MPDILDKPGGLCYNYFPMDHNGEINRIKAEYNRRDSDARLSGLYDRLNPAVIHIRHEIERHLAHFFNGGKRTAGAPGESKLIDIGCGGGAFFNMFAQLGFKPESLFGAELSYERITSAAQSVRGGMVNADAAGLPFRDSCFDYASQFTVFSSVIDKGLRTKIASEMKRVVKNGGYIISYDMLHTNPFNANLAPLKYAHFTELFGARPEACYRIVLNPIILRRLIERFGLVCDIFSSIKVLNSFYLAFIRVEK